MDQIEEGELLAEKRDKGIRKQQFGAERRLRCSLRKFGDPAKPGAEGNQTDGGESKSTSCQGPGEAKESPRIRA